MRAIAIFMVFIHAHPVWSLLGSLATGVLIFVLHLFYPRWIKLWILMPILLANYFFSLFAGHLISNPLLLKYGDTGEAIIVAQTNTSKLYNESPVQRYDVMIKGTGPNAKPVSTFCESWDFNITPQPHPDGYSWPAQGKQFNVRYLTEYPRAFVIISNDNSEYSSGLKCDHNAKEIYRLRSQLKMDPDNRGYKRALANLLEERHYRLDCDHFKKNRVLMKQVDEEIRSAK